MKPLHIAYINESKEPDKDNPARRGALRLYEDDLNTHIHGVGATRSGKSKWLEWFCRQLYTAGCGFTLIDPQGQLTEDLADYFVVQYPNRPVIVFDPNRTDYLIPFNPFRPVPRREGEDNTTYLARVYTRAREQRSAVMRVWGKEGITDTARLGRWLANLFFLFARGLATFEDASELLSLNGTTARERVARALEHEMPGIARDWLELNSFKRANDFYGQIESSRNRITEFVNNPQLRRVFVATDGLDFDQIFRSEAIVLCNLMPGDVLHAEDAQLFGSLIIYDLWKAVARYKASPNRLPYYLFVDEVQKFVTPDIKDILDRGAGKGLRLGVFHQHLTQLESQDDATYKSIVTNAKIKLAFGGLSSEDAHLMVRELYTGQIDLLEVKHLVEQTKFWPTYDRDTVRSRSRGRSTGSGTSAGTGTGISQSVGIPDDPNYSGGAYITSVDIASDFYGYNEIEMESIAEGEADVPIYRPEPFKEVTSVTHYSLEEQREQLAGMLIRQYTRHFLLRVPGRDTVPAATPFVKARHHPDRDEFIRNELIARHGRATAELDALLEPEEINQDHDPAPDTFIVPEAND